MVAPVGVSVTGTYCHSHLHKNTLPHNHILLGDWFRP